VVLPDVLAMLLQIRGASRRKGLAGMNQLVRQAAKLPVDIDRAREAIAAAKSPEDVRPIETDLEKAENLMRESGLFTKDQLRVVNETRMWAVWKLGSLLAKVDRAQGVRSDKKTTLSQAATKFRDFLKTLGLQKDRALERQRIGAMPEGEMAKALGAFHKNDDLATISGLLHRARPYWYQASRKAKHTIIAATAQMQPAALGPFPLIYADPPWKFNVYSEKGLDRTPDQHYPTLTDDEIMQFRVTGKLIHEIAHMDAVLLLWCTSSNIERALSVMSAWSFVYKTQAVWVKDKTGLGLVFRNQHEVLLYGTRGKMPGPQYQPPSVFHFPRGRHSAKPPEIRTEIEKMYPDFDAQTRLELFARETVPGWTPYGFESHSVAA
jgi:N6-adenosine-specific RNA methylase IME4